MDNKEKSFVSSVIYVHNSERQIAGFLSALIGFFQERFAFSEIICVDDYSSDHSVDIIKETAKDKADSISVSIVHLSYFHGVELAMQAGVDLAVGDYVFEFDRAVLDFSPDVVEGVYRRATGGCDIVSAAPQGGTKLSSKWFYWLFEKNSHFSARMATESFRVLSRRAINRVKTTNRVVPYRKAVYASSGLKTETVSYLPDDIDCGQDKETQKYKFGLAVDALLLFTEVGYRFAMVMTVIMMLLSIFMLAYSCVVYITASPVAGWTTTILFLSCTFFALFGILTIIIKYLQLLVNLQFKNKHYNYSSVEKI